MLYQFDFNRKFKVKVTSLTNVEIRRTLRSISSQDMNHGYELTSDSETRDQYKISLGSDFRHQSRDFKIGEKSRQIKLNVAVKLYDMNKGRLVLHNTIYFKVKIKCQGKW